MWNVNVGSARALFLVALIVSIGGCDPGVVPAPGPKGASNASQSQRPDARYQVDAARNRVWTLTPDGVFLHDAATGKDIEVPIPGWQWVDTQYACPPDLALGPNGEAVITSNVVPTLWRIDPETLAVTVHPLVLDADTDKDVGFSGLVYSSEHGAFFAISDTHGSLWRIDPLFKTAQKIPLSAPIASRRSASASAASCTDTPSLLNALSLKGE